MWGEKSLKNCCSDWTQTLEIFDNEFPDIFLIQLYSQAGLFRQFEIAVLRNRFPFEYFPEKLISGVRLDIWKILRQGTIGLGHDDM